KLNGSLGPAADVSAFVLSPDGGRVAFAADPDTDDLFELFTVRIDGSAAALRVSDPVVSPNSVWAEEFFTFTSNGRWLVSGTDAAPDGIVGEPEDRFDLFAAPADGSASPFPVSGPLTAGASVSIQNSLDYRANVPNTLSLFHVDERSLRVVYFADQD